MSNCTQNLVLQQHGKIASIVREVEKLSDTEKLLLYLQLPCGRANLNLAGESQAGASGRHKTTTAAASSQHQKPSTSTNGSGVDELPTIICAPKKPDNETTLTYTWILSHLEEDPNISLPKQEVYDEYRAFCQANRFEPLCVADFGKAMKHALPCIKPRRLGQRGNSRYCYSGLRKKYRIDPPACADLTAPDLMPPAGERAADLAQPITAGTSGIGHPGPTRGVKQQPPGAHQQPRPATTRSSGVLRNMQSLDLPSGGSSGSGDSGGGGGEGDVGGIGAGQQVRSHTASLATFSSGSGGLSPAGPQPKHLKTEAGASSICNAEGCGGGLNKQQVAPSCCAQMPNTSTRGGALQNTGQLQRRQPQQQQQVCVIDYTPNHPQHHSNNHHHHHHHHPSQYNNNHPTPQPPLVSNPLGGGQVPAPYQQQQQQQQSYLPRPGTPDDDDYRHNYHDLNRPMVGPPLIPFSQSISVQLAKQPAPHESFISYNTTSYPGTPAAPTAASAQQPQPQPPVAGPATPGASQQQQHHQQQQQPMHHMVMVPSCCSHETSLTSSGTSSVAMTTQAGAAATASSAAVIDNSRSFDNSPVRNNHTLAHLNLNSESADMDFASPFQSPASTPYSSAMLSNSVNPYLAGGGGGQDTQDYYMQQQDCSNIPYPDLQ